MERKMNTDERISISIEIPDSKENAFLKLEIDDPYVYVENRINGEITEKLKFNSQNIVVDLHHNPDMVAMNNILVYKFDSPDQVLGEITFAIQSETFLKSQYNFDVKNGYISLDRCTFRLPTPKEYIGNRADEVLITSKNRDKIEQLFENVLPGKLDKLKSEIGVLEKAEFITQFLYEIMDDFGPSDLIDGKNLGLYEKLRVIRDRRGSLLCQSLRDLFIEVYRLFDTSIELRKCNVFRYFPEIKNLMINSHSLLELKISNKWVAFDPTYRVFFSCISGEFLSVEDIYYARISGKLDSKKVHHIKTRREKSVDFDPENNPFDPDNYNYFSTYNFIEYTNLNFIDYAALLKESERCIEEGDIIRASELISTVLLHDPDDINMLNNSAVVAILLDESEEAKSILNKILDLDPGNEVAIENLKYINGSS